MRYFSLTLAAAACLAMPAFADGHGAWKSVEDSANVSFGSIKKNTVGEVHHFQTVTGEVSESGAVTITIDLNSVETWADIRNERMIKHVFDGGTATAVLSGQVDMAALEGIAVGRTEIVDLKGKLVFVGQEVPISAEMLVARLAENRVLVTTADMIMLSTADLGIDTGVDMLQKLAKLSGITRVTPVTVRMVFEK